ncbi:MAG: dTMP kinase [Candidatus Cloacimonadaceae bacterium]|nr:dTMP kinase [Candidatus Cloacimonadaceae bacterium]
MSGFFITFEGIEGSGKSTQIRLLGEKLSLQGIDYIVTREPGGPPISEAIRKILLDPANKEMLPETELLLYMASRSQHSGEWIIPALDSGKIVICDRYYDSTIAYQGAARDLDQEFIRALTRFATYATVPDITFLIDLPVSTGLARIQNRKLDRLEMEAASFHEKVRKQYLAIAAAEPLRYIILDGQMEPDRIHEDILHSVLSRIGVVNV